MTRVSWIAKKTNELVLNKAGVRNKLFKTVKAKKLSYYGHTMRKQGSARNNARCMQARKITHSLDGQHQDILTMEEKTRMAKNRGKWESTFMMCQTSDRARLKNRTEYNLRPNSYHLLKNRENWSSTC